MATRRPRVKPSAILKPRRIPNASAVAAAAASEAIASVQAKIEELITDESEFVTLAPGPNSLPNSAFDSGPNTSSHGVEFITPDVISSDALDAKYNPNDRDAVEVKPFHNRSPAHAASPTRSRLNDRPPIVSSLCIFFGNFSIDNEFTNLFSNFDRWMLIRIGPA